MPPPVDWRDAPFLWSQGDYPPAKWPKNSANFDFKNALMIGDVNDTVPRFLESRLGKAPIGFVSFDLDYYSSTMQALRIFESHCSDYLPRVWAYFDDVTGLPDQIGEMAAVSDWNDRMEDRFLAHPRGLRDLVPWNPPWADRMMQLHLLDHEKYSSRIGM